ncbi:MAG: hypothetical protein L2C94_007240 [Aigarchaeota archaeon]|nr:hypothetical protein [Candidatus Wolframiiraptor gerlachensis]
MSSGVAHSPIGLKDVAIIHINGVRYAMHSSQQARVTMIVSIWVLLILSPPYYLLNLE